MDREDALALLDVMRMQRVHEPPRIDRNRLGDAVAEVMIGEPFGRWEATSASSQINSSRE
jgi:hypothetical protein